MYAQFDIKNSACLDCTVSFIDFEMKNITVGRRYSLSRKVLHIYYIKKSVFARWKKVKYLESEKCCLQISKRFLQTAE